MKTKKSSVEFKDSVINNILSKQTIGELEKLNIKGGGNQDSLCTPTQTICTSCSPLDSACTPAPLSSCLGFFCKK